MVPCRLLLVALWLLLPATSSHAAGPLLVNGAGAALAWTAHPIPFNPDRGSLGALTNAAAVANVAANFTVWAAVPTASLTFTNAGLLPVDVTVANYGTYVGACGDGLDPIVFDTDGSITDDLFGAGASNDVLGFAGPDCATFVPPVITEGSAVLNGKWVDGIDTSTNPEIPLADFNGVFVHEFGHYVNLDHSQVNRFEAEDGDPADDDAIATMYPFLVDGAGMTVLHLDDRVAVSMLYPAPSFASDFGRVTGQVLRSDGSTPFQGAYVIARRVGDPRLTSVGMASGARYVPSAPGGPPAASLRGFFELPGLPPGSYTVEVEAIDQAFTGGSSVGPLDPPAVLPGPSEFWNGAAEAEANPPDDPSLAVPIAVTAGSTQTAINVVLNAVPAGPNDACSAATEASAPAFTDVIDTRAATTSTSDPFQSCSFAGPARNARSVWYRFTAPGDGTVLIDTQGSDYDTVLTAHAGGCASPVEVACSDDSGFGLQSSANFVASSGTTYLIEATGYGTSAGGKLEIHLQFLAGCGNDVVEAGEECDAGPGNGHDLCCSTSCRRVDADLDGICDRDDVCPSVPDAQTDTDGDGLGDACDICRTIVAGQRAWLRGRLVATAIDDGVSGNDRLKLAGEFALGTGAFTVNPSVNGALLQLRSALGIPRVSVVLPAGAFASPGPGWTAGGSRFVFRDLRAGGTGGIRKLVVRDRGAGRVQVVVTGARATFPLVAADAPLEATLVLGGTAAGAAGECGELVFPGPAPTCRTNAAGTRIACD